MRSAHVDVLIIGAGVSGIGAAYHLQDKLPGKTYAILEARDDLGGTWDLHRYPGIRSDSDLHTFGYAFKPWVGDKAIADGPSILSYLRETAAENGIDRHIRFGQKVVAVDFDSETGICTATTDANGERHQFTSNWLFCATGYYDYDNGYTPDFEGRESFAGEVVHPQHWPEDLDYAGKRVVIIGSGATSVTLAPAMADDAASVTVVQRSPTYVLPVPEKDRIANFLRDRLGERLGYRLAREKNILRQRFVFEFAQRFPGPARRLIRAVNALELRNSDCDVDLHFNPRYGPWDQRLCAVPDGDLFEKIRQGRIRMVTDTVGRFTESGLRTGSGTDIPADIIITATGLNLQTFGGIDASIDGEHVDASSRVAYRGMMLNDVPNFVFAIGYTNSSWTLKVDLVCEYMCRLIAYADEHGYDICMPHMDKSQASLQPLLDFPAGYVQRSLHLLPKQGAAEPWINSMNYNHDRRVLRTGDVTEDMVFSSVQAADRAKVPA